MEKECVRPGSAETESKPPLKESWPQPSSSSADKGVTEQACPFPGGLSFLSGTVRKQVALATEAPARASNTAGCQLAGSPTAYKLWSHKTVFPAKADKPASN